MEDHPDPQRSLEDRFQNAQKFLEQNPNCRYTVLVDNWENETNFEEIYHAWPDKYILLDEDHKIIEKSTYHKEGEKDGKIKLDSVDLLLNLIKEQ